MKLINILLATAWAYNCLDNRYPLDYGTVNADGATYATKVLQYGSDFIIGGITHDSSLKAGSGSRSPFITRENLLNTIFMKTYFWQNQIDMLDQLFANSAQSKIFAIMSGESSTSETDVFVMEINDQNGFVNRLYKIDKDTDPMYDKNILLSGGSGGSNRGIMVAYSDTEIYFGINLKDGSKYGIFRLGNNGLFSSWHKTVNCAIASGSECYTDTLMSAGGTGVLLGGTILDKVKSKTLTTFTAFKFDGTHYWDLYIQQDNSILTSYHRVHSIFMEQGYVAILGYSDPNIQAPIIMVELSSQAGQSGNTNTNLNNGPSNQYTYEIGGSFAYELNHVKALSANHIYISLQDNTNQVSKIFKVTGNSKGTPGVYKEITLPYLAADAFWLDPNINDLDFYFVGSESSLSDGTKTGSFGQKRGFLMPLNMVYDDFNCLNQQGYTWGTDIGFVSVSWQEINQVGVTGWAAGSSVEIKDLIPLSEVTDKVWNDQTGVFDDIITYYAQRNIGGYKTWNRFWCWRYMENGIESFDSGLAAKYTYRVTDVKQSHPFNHFTLIDETCEDLIKKYSIVMTNEEPLGTTKSFSPGFPVLINSQTALSLDIETRWNKWISSHQNGYVYEGEDHTLTIRGYIGNAKAVMYPLSQIEVFHSAIDLDVQKDCRRVVLTKPSQYTQILHSQPDYIIGTADALTGAASAQLDSYDREIFLFTSDDPECIVHHELYYYTGSKTSSVDEAQIGAQFPAIKDGILYKTSNLDKWFFLNWEKPILNSEAPQELLFVLKAYVPLTDSVSINTGDPVPKDYQMLNLKLWPNCNLESITPSTISDQSYTFGLSTLKYLLPAFTSSHSWCDFTYALQFKKSDGSWETITDGQFTETTTLIKFKNSTRELEVYYNVDNRYSKKNDPTLNVYELRLKGTQFGGKVDYSNEFKLNVQKNCQFAQLSGNSIAQSSMTYIASDISQSNLYTTPFNTDEYCVVYHSIQVDLNSAGNFVDFKTAFGSDPNTAFTHSDGLSRIDSYLIQNRSISDPEKIDIQVFTSSLDYLKLNDYVGTHKIRILSEIGQNEPSSGSRSSVFSEFTLNVENFCNILLITPKIYTDDIFFGVYEPLKTNYMQKFDLSWPWVDRNAPTTPLTELTSVKESQVRAICGDWKYSIVDFATGSQIDSEMNFFHDQTQLWLQFKSYDIQKAYTNSGLPNMKKYMMTISAELEGWPQLKKSSNINAWVQYYCRNKEILSLTCDSKDVDGLTYKDLVYEINANNLILQQQMGSYNWNTSCATKIIPTLTLIQVQKYSFTAALNSEQVFVSENNIFFVQKIDKNIYSQKVLVKYYFNQIITRDDGQEVNLNLEHPELPYYYGSFYLQIDPCRVSSIIAPKISNFYYQIESNLQVHQVNSPYVLYKKCPYELSFDSFVLETDISGKTSLKELPEYVKFNSSDPNNLKWSIYTKDRTLKDKELNIIARLTVHDEEMQTNQDLAWKLKLIWSPFYPQNQPPVLYRKPIDIHLPVGKLYKFTINKEDLSSDTISLKLNCLLPCPPFIKFEQNKELETTITIYPTSEEQIGDYSLNIVIKDKIREEESGLENIESFYPFKLRVYKEYEQEEKYAKMLDPEYLNATIENVNEYGYMNITFDENIRVPTQAFYWKDIWRIRFKQILRIEILPGNNQERSKLAFDYDLVNFTKSHIEIKLKFEQPIYISQASSLDIVNVTFMQNDFFQTERSNKIFVEQNSSIYHQIPPQMAEPKIFKEASDKFIKASSAVVAVQYVSSIGLQGPLSHIWGMVNTLQVVLHLEGTEIQFPTNTKHVFGGIRFLTEFKIFPENWLDKFHFWRLFSGQPQQNKRKLQEESIFEEDQYDYKGLKSSGYDSIDLISNLESIFGMILISIIFMIIIIPIIYCLQRRFQSFRKIYLYFKKVFFWTGMVRFFLEGYLELCVTVMITVKLLIDNKFSLYAKEGISRPQQFTSLLLTFILLFMIFAVPIYSFKLMFDNKTYLQKLKKEQPRNFKAWEDKYGSMVHGLHLERQYSIVHQSIFMFRRLIVALSLVWLNGYPYFQIMIVNQTNLIILICIGLGRPHDSRLMNKMELANEFLTCIGTYIVYTFTDLNPDIQKRHQMGYVLIGLVVFIIIFNILIMLKLSINQLKRCYNRKMAQRRYNLQCKRIREQKYKNCKTEKDLENEYKENWQHYQKKQFMGLSFREETKYKLGNKAYDEFDNLDKQIEKKIKSDHAFIAESKKPNRFVQQLKLQLKKEEAQKETKDQMKTKNLGVKNMRKINYNPRLSNIPEDSKEQLGTSVNNIAGEGDIVPIYIQEEAHNYKRNSRVFSRASPRRISQVQQPKSRSVPLKKDYLAKPKKQVRFADQEIEKPSLKPVVHRPQKLSPQSKLSQIRRRY